ncbi:hypothetical protein SAMN04487943_107113 [Gracilibacillus orientalis]|uniref:Uncharacterized protein n=1 Tax=Gracilibacillus orientalis TaxID=334253 RepID=A0A1I4MVJ2_9BACI|nr:hypothetical protein SAMN04487943_107113 [Gracilibacillus orientalis]
MVSFVLLGCQNNNLNLNQDVTNIGVYERDSDEQIATIDDKEFIEELVNSLDNAKTGSTANMNFELPDYDLHFNNDEETLFKIGYYKKLVNLGVEGRYLDFREDIT